MPCGDFCQNRQKIPVSDESLTSLTFLEHTKKKVLINFTQGILILSIYEKVCVY